MLLFVVVHESESGTLETSRNVRSPVAVVGKADTARIANFGRVSILTLGYREGCKRRPRKTWSGCWHRCVRNEIIRAARSHSRRHRGPRSAGKPRRLIAPHHRNSCIALNQLAKPSCVAARSHGVNLGHTYNIRFCSQRWPITVGAQYGS
jgi:hypothetical protein